jgi:hypothetical protein
MTEGIFGNLFSVYDSDSESQAGVSEHVAGGSADAPRLMAGGVAGAAQAPPTLLGGHGAVRGSVAGGGFGGHPQPSHVGGANPIGADGVAAHATAASAGRHPVGKGATHAPAVISSAAVGYHSVGGDDRGNARGVANTAAVSSDEQPSHTNRGAAIAPHHPALPIDASAAGSPSPFVSSPVANTPPAVPMPTRTMSASASTVTAVSTRAAAQSETTVPIAAKRRRVEVTKIAELSPERCERSHSLSIFATATTACTTTTTTTTSTQSPPP